ncbi:hypothetical protein B0H17DRAFT_1051626 [Mycena rosella]|uniref:BTB domain-containing protein n=1 Tax=Mycena rosella TaxID=1033263 RepID=A0AAD7GNN2_MYCRO|nr:hypothetical protein B0H17DRAFT_1051626 [Mycena rosella]
MSEGSSAKRKRTEDPPAEPADAAPLRSKIWMPYGDIILQAESTQFRVNRDVLAQQSSVFRDMFSVPQPPNEPTVEGCPVVHVSATATDWELLLDVLYHPFHSGSRPFNVVASMLRLGRKYDIHDAKEDAVSRIRYEFPYSDLNMTKIQSRDVLHSPHLSANPDAIQETLLSGVPRNDGSRVNLPDNIKLTLAIALERILLFQRETLSWLEGDDVVPHESCDLPDKEKLDLAYTIDAWDEQWSGKLCGVCEDAAKACYETSRQKGWDLLPSFFGLPGWEDLEKMME